MCDIKDNLETREIKLWPLIRHFLHKHNTLCLEGLGRFVSELQPVYVDPLSKKMYPASRKIVFQAGEFGNSKEFLTFSSAVLNVDEALVVDKINSFSAALLGAVKDNKKFEAEQLGVFKFNVMGELDFEMVRTEGFCDESFGLNPIHFAANLLKTKRIVVDPAEEQEKAELSQMQETALKELKAMLDQAQIAESSEEKKPSRIFPIVATVLTIILLINLGYFLFNGPVEQLKNQISQMDMLGKTGEIIDTQKLQQSMAPDRNVAGNVESTPTVAPVSADSIALHTGVIFKMSETEFDSIRYTPLASENHSLTISETPASAIEKIEEVNKEIEPAPAPVKADVKPLLKTETVSKAVKPETTSKTSANREPNMVNADAANNNVSKGFYVIAGAFRSENNAAKLLKNLKENGDTDAVVIKPSHHPFYLVAYKNNNTLNQALNMAEKKQVSLPSVWVYCAY